MWSLSLPRDRGLFDLHRPSLKAMIAGAAAALLAAASAFGGAAYLEHRQQAAGGAKLSFAAETAALAAAGALADGRSASEAEATGRRSFADSAPEAAPAEVVADAFGGFATATIAYVEPVGPIARRFGAASHPRQSVARMQLLPGATHAFLTLDETALPDGCARAAQPWTLALADAGFSLSVRCAHSAAWNRDHISGFALQLGAHRLVVLAREPYLKPRPDGGFDLDYADGAWSGAVEIDGVAYPAARGVSRHLGGLVSVETLNLDFAGEGGNRVVVTAGVAPTQYQLTLTFDAFQFGEMTIEATDPGRCAALAGFLAARLPALDEGAQSCKAAENAEPG